MKESEIKRQTDELNQIPLRYLVVGLGRLWEEQTVIQDINIKERRPNSKNKHTKPETAVRAAMEDVRAGADPPTATSNERSKSASSLKSIVNNAIPLMY